MGELATVEILLRGLAIGATAATAIGLTRGAGRSAGQLAGVLFCLSAMAYALNSSGETREAIGWLIYPVWLASLGGGGLFWLFVVSLFDDRPIRWQGFAPAILLTLVGLAGILAIPPAADIVWIGHNVIEVSFAAHALVVVVRSWRGDLVEARRRLRGAFMAALTVYVIVLSGFEIAEIAGFQPWWRSLAGAGALAIFCLAGSLVFLQARTALFGSPTASKRPVAEPDAADRPTLARLAKAMDEDRLWRREGLTVGALAEAVGAPEHRLRRLINDHLGHRNFADFINARRIEAAKAALADPEAARTTVAAIAFDLGFGSLGPFNRAFKEVTGLTPTAWRRRALGEASPIPENPG